ncbi:hypothetical protein [Thalassospira lucentensis]|uniref:hypothetical protein n=1 Tax=Thalassospira lucentensis TaxID=168935 RepID=UPI00142DAB5D|nr:hypothetical protein [Thalassospira lucentensis]NIZ00659.1 hypothetical protein [Thalassospira lucentensis]
MAVDLSVALAVFENAKDLPDLVVILGSTRSRTLDQAQVYQAISVFYRNMDTLVSDFQKVGRRL